MTIEQVQLTPEAWEHFFRFYKGLPTQRKAVEILRQHILESDPGLLTDTAAWVTAYRETPSAPKAISVPYFNQLLMDDGQGWRDCFSATCAMIAAWKGKVSGENEYNHERQKHGDSTVAAAQVAALAHFGLTATYKTTGTKAELVKLLDQGIPVGTGILHHGMASSPTGGGHWMLIVGHDDHGVIALDPYGELNVVNGTWARQGSGGDHVHYSWKNWLPRWEVAGGDGYMLFCR